MSPQLSFKESVVVLYACSLLGQGRIFKILHIRNVICPPHAAGFRNCSNVWGIICLALYIPLGSIQCVLAYPIPTMAHRELSYQPPHRFI